MKNNTTSVVTTIPSKVASVSTDLVKILFTGTTETFSDFSESNRSTQQLWNDSKTTAQVLPVDTTKSTLCTTTTTIDPLDEFGPPEGVEYIFVPLGVMIFVVILSAVVLIISRKRKLERLRHRLMPLYNFDPGEEGEDDWETELLDEGFSSCQRRT
ncbi:uncharacterized protein C3orf18 isoform X2 [Orussus abietinus]|uniref:uncharacterized protein C3orf18 isoform X2 n=1 Tax=Orussus abietinus TaxID=222816 RepID=UPI000C715B90|nr:uncharacterized protein C3orf18 isoform X2 [Orussus abietinus]